MAERLSPDGLARLEKRDYAKLRPDLRSGDLLFAAGNYPLSRVIQKFTDSVWSHVGVVLRAETIRRVLLLESVEDVGVRLIPLSKYLDDYENDGKGYDGALVLARPENVTAELVTRIGEFGADQLGRPYDKDALIDIVMRIVFNQGRPGHPERRYICSELVQACFAAGGYPFPANAKGFISAEGIWRDPRVGLLARIL
jgi:hypothetical protein